MSLKARIIEDMKAAMKARETERLGAIRLLLVAVKQKEVDERKELDDASVLSEEYLSITPDRSQHEIHHRI